MKFVRLSGLGVLLLVMSACSTLQSLTGSTQAFPNLEPGKGRVFFYRNGALISTVTMDTSFALLNGERVGKFNRPGVYFRDVPPGSYAVTTTMTAKIVFFKLAAGESRYVRFDNSIFDSILHPELVDAAKGVGEVSGLDRLGP